MKSISVHQLSTLQAKRLSDGSPMMPAASPGRGNANEAPAKHAACKTSLLDTCIPLTPLFPATLANGAGTGNPAAGFPVIVAVQWQPHSRKQQRLGVGGMQEIHEKRLFMASCMALILTSMTFAIRARLETVFGPAGVGLTLEEIGYAFMPAFWGFTLAMVIGGPIVEYIGMRKGMWLAFILHTVGIVATLFAYDLATLFTATVFIGIGNGMVEAVCNPLVASMYPDKKTKMLNRFHIWFPGGIVIGSIIGYVLMDVLGLGWQVLVSTLFIPLAVYGFLFVGQAFPQTERVQMGVSARQSAMSLLTPLYLFVGFCMLLSAATELGTTQRIESLLSATGVNALLVLAFINGIMMIGRAMAGSIANRISTVGMLWFSAIFSFIGLQLLTMASGSFVFVAAAVFAIGVTFFWPTTLR
jgi:MFS family permease